MRVAIFHDFLDQKGGEEKFVLELARELNADIITVSFDAEKIEEMGFSELKIIELKSILKKFFPKNILSLFLFATCDFRKNYDFFILSGYHSIFTAKKHKPAILYFHNVQTDFFEKSNSGFFKDLFLKFKGIFIKVLLNSRLNSIKKIVVNSLDTKKKIKKYLGLNSQVIHPIINTALFKQKKSKGYWLSVNRIHPQKRITLQLDSFRLLPEKKLLVVSDYLDWRGENNYASNIMKIKPRNVEFLFNVNFEKLVELYSGCEGFIATGKNESFGMAVIEAMASGKPVVCVDEGGFRETVVDGKTGFLVKANPKELVNAIKKVSRNPEKFKNACIKQAKKFDSGVFFKKIKKIMND